MGWEYWRVWLPTMHFVLRLAKLVAFFPSLLTTLKFTIVSCESQLIWKTHIAKLSKEAFNFWRCWQVQQAIQAKSCGQQLPVSSPPSRMCEIYWSGKKGLGIFNNLPWKYWPTWHWMNQLVKLLVAREGLSKFSWLYLLDEKCHFGWVLKVLELTK